MARCLIIGCGCRGIELARELRERGHAVRGTTRRASHLAAIEQAGTQAHLGDPERVATLTSAFEHVAAVCILLGSATGSGEELAALHGPRLEMLLARMLDTTIRAIVYEGAGTVSGDLLLAGARTVRRTCEDSMIPHAILTADPGDHAAWTTAAAGSIEALLGRYSRTRHLNT